jgi:hypothetical protein
MNKLSIQLYNYILLKILPAVIIKTFIRLLNATFTFWCSEICQLKAQPPVSQFIVRLSIHACLVVENTFSGKNTTHRKEGKGVYEIKLKKALGITVNIETWGCACKNARLNPPN